MHAQGAELADVKKQLQAQENAAAQSAAQLETLRSSVYDLHRQLAAASTALNDCRTAAAEEVVRAVATAEEAAREQLELVRRELKDEAARESAQATDMLQKALDDAAANREQLLQVVNLRSSVLIEARRRALTISLTVLFKSLCRVRPGADHCDTRLCAVVPT